EAVPAEDARRAAELAGLRPSAQELRPVVAERPDVLPLADDHDALPRREREPRSASAQVLRAERLAGRRAEREELARLARLRRDGRETKRASHVRRSSSSTTRSSSGGASAGPWRVRSRRTGPRGTDRAPRLRTFR